MSYGSTNSRPAHPSRRQAPRPVRPPHARCTPSAPCRPSLRVAGRKEGLDEGGPASAYLPSEIEKERRGWSQAAGRTEGLTWIAPRYTDVLRESADVEDLKALKFLRLLGAEIAPRLTSSSVS